MKACDGSIANSTSTKPDTWMPLLVIRSVHVLRPSFRSFSDPAVRRCLKSQLPDLEEMTAERGMRFTGAGKAGPLLHS